MFAMNTTDHLPIITNTCPPKRSDKSLHPKLVSNLPTVSDWEIALALFTVTPCCKAGENQNRHSSLVRDTC